jgi:hypothetical protein
MKESHRKGIAIHGGPASVASRKAAVEAMTAAQAGWVLSSEIVATAVPTSFSMVEGNTGGCAIASTPRDSERSKTPGMHGNTHSGRVQNSNPPILTELNLDFGGDE